ncbi:hypothetical protein HanIR_Chr01g0030641 [Helianthus annuus]|nr:hypothetical protein HanIR_Chr01g0030641 [Helianthus annuus]
MMEFWCWFWLSLVQLVVDEAGKKEMQVGGGYGGGGSGGGWWLWWCMKKGWGLFKEGVFLSFHTLLTEKIN